MTTTELQKCEAVEPKLERSMSPFSSFAIAMSTICILAGGITSFPAGFGSVGGAAIGLGWPLVWLFALIVALTMAQVASAFPTAGGTYHWAYTLGGRGWGWVTACFSLAGLVTALAAVNVGLCRFVIGAMSRIGEYDPDNVYPWLQHAAVVLMTFGQAWVNHRGIRLTSRLNDFNGYLILVVAVLFTAVLLAFGIPGAGFHPDRLVTFTNFSGVPARDPVWPPTDNITWLFLLGFLLPAYTLTCFDAAAQTSEETIDAPRAVPRGIVRAVLISGLAGWVLLSAVVLAAPDMDGAAEAGPQSFFWIIRQALPYWTHAPLYVGLGVAQFLCGLAIVTSASRMTFAFARDGGLPYSRYLRRVSPSHRTPSVAIWAFAAAAALFAVFIRYETIAAVCAIFLYLSYVVPTALGVLAHGRTWTRMGPWQLGRWYRPLAALCVAGCALLFVIGVQPPNDIALWVMGGSFVLLAALWFGYMRRHFPGPPQTVLDLLRKSP
jgi:amino acid transporter